MTSNQNDVSIEPQFSEEFLGILKKLGLDPKVFCENYSDMKALVTQGLADEFTWDSDGPEVQRVAWFVVEVVSMSIIATGAKLTQGGA